jgi:hypothetical protein
VREVLDLWCGVGGFIWLLGGGGWRGEGRGGIGKIGGYMRDDEEEEGIMENG